MIFCKNQGAGKGFFEDWFARPELAISSQSIEAEKNISDHVIAEDHELWKTAWNNGDEKPVMWKFFSIFDNSRPAKPFGQNINYDDDENSSESDDQIDDHSCSIIKLHNRLG